VTDTATAYTMRGQRGMMKIKYSNNTCL